MDKNESKKRIEKLRQAINRHRYLYHVLDRQEISDSALDSLKKELFDLEQKYPEFITADSPTQRVGGKPLKEFKKVRHFKKMLSFNDAFSKDDVKDWLERISKLLTDNEKKQLSFYCELKIDGLAVELEYQDGLLKTGSTRGDGLIGEDITQNLKTIEAIPLMLQKSKIGERFVVRGEVFISKKEFQAVNKIQLEKGLPLFANPRNIAAGSVRQLDPKITADRKLDSFAYDIATDEVCKTHEERHQSLKELGFKTNSHNKYCLSIEDVFAFYEECGKIREKLDYEIDGVVVIINNNRIFEKLGIVGKAPRGAVAFKFAQNQATTKVLDVKIQVGRTGAITPVAILEPVRISGITITRATLHNQDEIKKLDLKIGDTVVVGRAGDVIPDVIKVLAELRTGGEKSFEMPKFCPSCGSKLSRSRSDRGSSMQSGEKSQTEALLRCPNPKCFARQRRFFYHFVSRGAFNMEGLGPKIIDRLLDEGLVQDPGDLFELKEGDVAQLERFAQKSSENLINSISERRELALARFIYALGIRNIGEQTANDLAKNFHSIDNLKKASIRELESILNIGPIAAGSVYEWFSNKDNLKFLDKLLKAGVEIINPKKVSTGKLQGKIFVFTGTLNSIERNSAKEKVRLLGGQVSESISPKIDFVVTGSNPGSKLKKAKELGLKLIDEEQFLEMIK